MPFHILTFTICLQIFAPSISSTVSSCLTTGEDLISLLQSKVPVASDLEIKQEWKMTSNLIRTVNATVKSGEDQSAVGSSDTRNCFPCPMSTSWSKNISFIHISKCGGANFIEFMLAKNCSDFYPTITSGAEHGFLFDVQNRPVAQRLVMLRDPREHLWSMYAECTYDKDYHYENANISAFRQQSSDREGFSRWVLDYCSAHGELNLAQEVMRKKWECYHPANYQTRALVSPYGESHFPTRDSELIPNIELALGALRSMSWIGVTEFWHASVCLLLAGSIDLTKEAQQYLDTQCRCPHVAVAKPYRSHHGHVRQFKDMEDLDPAILACADNLTKVDAELVKFVVPEFLQNVVAVEIRLSRRFLCDDDLDAAQVRFEHLMLDVSTLYTHFKNTLYSLQSLACCI